MPRIERVVHLMANGRQLPVRIVYHSRLASLIIPHMSAITLGRTIYVRGQAMSSRLLRHELRHVEQWEELGRTRFLVLYLWESIRHGYRNNQFEIDARRAESVDDGSLLRAD